MSDGDGVGSSGDAGEDLGVLFQVDDGRAGDAEGLGGGGSRGAGEGDGAEVGESDQGAALLEVLDDPLCVLASKGSLVEVYVSNCN